jgi:hypothetical protein
VNERFPELLKTRPSIPIYVVGEFHLNRLPANLAHADGFGDANFSVLELDVIVTVESVLSHCQFVRMSKLNVPVVVLQPGLNGQTSMSNVDLATFTGDAVHTWCLQSQSFTGQSKLAIFLCGRP